MQAVALGYGFQQILGSREIYPEIENKPIKPSRSERKKRSDACVQFMLLQYTGKTVFSKKLKDVLFGKTKSEQNRFFFECRRRGVEVLDG